MEIIRKGSDKLSKVTPRGCCWPPGAMGLRAG